MLRENDTGSAEETYGLDPDEWNSVLVGPTKRRDLLCDLTCNIGRDNHGELREEQRVLGQGREDIFGDPMTADILVQLSEKFGCTLCPGLSKAISIQEEVGADIALSNRSLVDNRELSNTYVGQIKKKLEESWWREKVKGDAVNSMDMIAVQRERAYLGEPSS